MRTLLLWKERKVPLLLVVTSKEVNVKAVAVGVVVEVERETLLGAISMYRQGLDSVAFLGVDRADRTW